MHIHTIRELINIVRYKHVILGSIVHKKKHSRREPTTENSIPTDKRPKRDACGTWTLIEIAIIVYRICSKIYQSKWYVIYS